jgi:hypothetical protein
MWPRRTRGLIRVGRRRADVFDVDGYRAGRTGGYRSSYGRCAADRADRACGSSANGTGAVGLLQPSEPGSKYGDFGILLGRAVAVLNEQADVSQASPRPPRADEVAVGVGAVAGDDVANRASPRAASGQTVTPVILSLSTKTSSNPQVAVDEHWCPRPQSSLGEPGVGCDDVGAKDIVGDEPLALAGGA